MAKQKIVVKLHMEDAKRRSKAMKIAVGLEGVLSASLDGEDKIVVTGNGVDPICLTTGLRKRMGYAELLSVTADEEKKDKDKDKTTEASKPVEVGPWPTHPYVGFQPIYYEDHVPNQDPCRVM